jgi:hypothetical protein
MRSRNPPSGPKSCCHSGFQMNAEPQRTASARR